MYIVIATIVIVAISALFMWLRNRGCATASATNAYEQFANSGGTLDSEISKRIEKIQTLRETLEDDLDALDSVEDDTCDILRSVEENVVSGAAQPSDSSELDLPLEVQKRRAEQRKRRAVLNFKQRRSDAAALLGKPVLECFATSAETLESETRNLEAVLDRAALRVSSIEAALAFNEKYLQRGAEAATEGIEAFANADSSSVIAAADRAIGRALALHESVLALKNTIAIQRKIAAGIQKRTADLP
jgi:uncharacterized membrane protein